MQNSTNSARAVVAEEVTQLNFFPNEGLIDYSVIGRPHRPSPEQGSFFMFTQEHAKLALQLSPCASALYQFLLSKPAPAGADLHIDAIAEFQAFSAEYRIVRNSQGAKKFKAYGRRNIERALEELRELELFSGCRKKKVLTPSKLHLPGPVVPLTFPKEPQKSIAKKMSERTTFNSPEEAETLPVKGSQILQKTEQNINTRRSNRELTRTPPLGGGESFAETEKGSVGALEIVGSGGAAAARATAPAPSDIVASLADLAGIDSSVGQILGEAISEPPLITRNGIAESVKKRLKEAQIPPGKAILTSLLAFTRNSSVPWVTNTLLLAALEAVEEAISRKRVKNSTGYFRKALQAKYRPNFPTDELKARLDLLERLNSPSAALPGAPPASPVRAIVPRQAVVITPSDPPLSEEIPENPAKPPATVKAEIVANFQALDLKIGRGEVVANDPTPYQNTKRLRILGLLDDDEVVDCLRGADHGKVSEALDWTESVFATGGKGAPGSLGRTLIGYLLANTPPPGSG